MKKHIAFMISCFLSMNVIAQDIKQESKKQDPVEKIEKYCAMLKDGRMVLMQDNMPVSAEVSLNDGSKVTTTGIVIRKNGTVVVLNDGDCIDKEGNINNIIAPQTPVKTRAK